MAKRLCSIQGCGVKNARLRVEEKSIVSWMCMKHGRQRFGYECMNRLKHYACERGSYELLLFVRGEAVKVPVE